MVRKIFDKDVFFNGSEKRKVVAKSTSYATIERLQSYRLVKRILTEGRRRYAITLLGFCAMIWEGIEQILEKRDEVITKNPHILPTIFNHWSTFKEDLRNEIWGRILEYVHSEFEARLLLFQNKYSLMELENVEKILEYDLTRFIVFPWIHEFIDKLLFLYCREELDVDQAPDEEVRKAVEFVLGRTLVVKTLENARAIGIGKVRMVTLDGDLIEKSGAMVGGYLLRTHPVYSAIKPDVLINS